MAKEKSVRWKPYCRVGTIGHSGHGKTALIKAMARVSADQGWVDTQDTGRGLQPALTEYSTANRYYSHTDCPGLADFETSLIAGRTPMDVPILVISAVEGITPQTRLHIFLVRQLGASQVVVFLNKCDLMSSGELLDLVEQEVRELLTSCGYNEKATPIVRGSAIKALGGEKGPLADEAILHLFDALDHIDLPPRPKDRPFLMAIEDIITIEGRDIMTTGRIESGLIRVDDEVEIVGYGAPRRALTTAIEMFRKPLDEGLPGDNVCISLRGIGRYLLKRGQVLSTPSTAKAHCRFTAKIYMLAESEGSIHKAMSNLDTLQFFFRIVDVMGSVKLCDGVEMVMPGDVTEIIVDLCHAIPMERLSRFFIREGNRTIGYGVVTRIEAE